MMASDELPSTTEQLLNRMDVEIPLNHKFSQMSHIFVGRCGVVGSTLAFGSIGHGFESEHFLFSHHGASAFSKLISLAKCSLDD